MTGADRDHLKCWQSDAKMGRVLLSFGARPWDARARRTLLVQAHLHDALHPGPRAQCHGMVLELCRSVVKAGTADQRDYAHIAHVLGRLLIEHARKNGVRCDGEEMAG